MLELTLHSHQNIAADVALYGEGGFRFDCRLYAQGGPDVVLRPFQYINGVLVGGVVFPTQYSGLRVRGVSATLDLCLVDTADAPSGDTPRIQKGGVTYALYLVDTTDPLASPVRIGTGAGTKAVRLKT